MPDIERTIEGIAMKDEEVGKWQIVDIETFQLTDLEQALSYLQNGSRFMLVFSYAEEITLPVGCQ